MRTPEQEKQWQVVVESVAKQIFNKYRHFTWPVWDKYNNTYVKQKFREFADQILSISSIAVVDSDQELPQNPWYDVTSGHWLGCDMAYRDMINDNWKKVIPKE